MPATGSAVDLREIGLDHHRRSDLRSAAPCYRAALTLDPSDAEAWQRLGVLFRQLKEPASALVSFRRSLAAEPGNALRFGNLGIALRDVGRLDDARAAHRRSLALDPERSGSHFNVGVVSMAHEMYDQAALSFGRAVAADPANADALDALGSAARGCGRPIDACRWHRRAIAWRPTFAAAKFNLGGALQAQAVWESSIAWYRRALAVRPGFAEAEWELSFPLLILGRLREGFRAFDGRWRSAGFPAAARRLEKPIWTGEPLAGQRLLVHAEQGFGDTIQFARYLSLISGAGEIFAEVQRPLVELARTLRPDLNVFATGDPLPVHDLQVPLMDLPRILGTDLESIPSEVPYFRLPPPLARSERRTIGIAWTPSRTNRTFVAKSIALDRLLQAFEQVDCRLVSLQVDADARAELRGRDIVDAGAGFENFLDTATYLLGVDLVVTIDTALAHLAGALGRPVWVMLPAVADWRWLLGRRDSPWYPTMRLYRQSSAGDWTTVIRELAKDLTAA